ncbi:MAG TPA: MerR family transcriptional regulator [Mycobacteriales bacterium]|nr:MerR family transcriptional regulator [Mycobacteriales bacterium]
MSRSSAARSYFSIGEVLAQLQPEFPDVTLSKLRHWEAEGLVTPERTPAGYRQFSRDDVARLTYIARARDYLSLAIIKKQLDAADRGETPPPLPDGPIRPPRALTAAPDAEEFRPPSRPRRLTRDQLCAAAEISIEELEELVQFGLLPARTRSYDETAVTIARTAAELRSYGIEPRHLRAFRNAADREISLFSQVVTPLIRQGSPEAHGRAEESVLELAALSVRLHAALVKAGLHGVLGQ